MPRSEAEKLAHAPPGRSPAGGCGGALLWQHRPRAQHGWDQASGAAALPSPAVTEASRLLTPQAQNTLAWVHCSAPAGPLQITWPQFRKLGPTGKKVSRDKQ